MAIGPNAQQGNEPCGGLFGPPSPWPLTGAILHGAPAGAWVWRRAQPPGPPRSAERARAHPARRAPWASVHLRYTCGNVAGNVPVLDSIWGNAMTAGKPLLWLLLGAGAVALVWLLAPHPIGLTEGEFFWLAQPCRGINRALQDIGLNPDMSTPGIDLLKRRAHYIMLPIFVEVALNPELTDHPSLIRTRMRDQASLPRGLYTPSDLPAMRARLLTAITAAHPTAGADWVRRVLEDPALGPPWEATLNWRGLGENATCLPLQPRPRLGPGH